MTKFNKAQQRIIDIYTKHYDGWTSPTVFEQMAEAILAVDPTPDKETYCIWKKTEWVDEAVEENLTLDEATNTLTIQMNQTFAASVVEYKKGEYLKTLSGTTYTIKKED